MPQSFKLGNGIVDRGWDSPPLEKCPGVLQQSGVF